MVEKYCLKWNDFQSNVISAFSVLRTKSNFQDVTLVSDDHKQLFAHRVVLTACSEYFNDVLSQNTHSHPLLCLDGIKFKELNNVLDYIYNGEVQIYQEDLDRFLQIAQRLKLQGLLSPKDNEQKENIEEPTTLEAKMNGSENKNVIVPVQNKETRIIAMDSVDFQNIEELDIYIDEQITSTEEGYKCNICKRMSKIRGNIKEHIEVHINGLSFNCDLCGHTLNSRTTLRYHKRRSCKKRFL